MRAPDVDLLTSLGIEPDRLAARQLVRYDEPTCLECVQVDADGRQHYLLPAAAAAYRRMHRAAAANGIAFTIVSAFRSIERQVAIVRCKLEQGQLPENILRYVAPPGFSEHHSGRAVDLTSPGTRPLEREFEDSVAFAWLTQRAGEFGYRLSYPESNAQGYAYEPWHWCWHP